MDKTEKLFKYLKDDFGFEGAEGSIEFNLKDYKIIVEQNNEIGRASCRERV